MQRKMKIRALVALGFLIIIYMALVPSSSMYMYYHYTQSISFTRQSHKAWYLSNRISFLQNPRTFQPVISGIKHIFWINPAEWQRNTLLNNNLQDCKVNTCEIHLDEKHLNTSDAVVFHATNYAQNPPERPPNQIWVFATMESPYNNKLGPWKSELWKKQINWTMTYRFDSDLILGYGSVKKVSSPLSSFDFEAVVVKKKKLVAWVVSHCITYSDREGYVDELSRYISVDIYGACGKSTKENTDDLLNRLEQDYKFFLAFENSLCVDYVSEKFFRVQSRNLVVVVRGSANYSEIYPDDTFIITNDFKSPKDLAETLLYLNKNPSAYTRYLSQKAMYRPFTELDIGSWNVWIVC